MNLTRVKALFKREVTDVLRDKKTLVMMVVIPLFLYPLLIIVMTLIMSELASTDKDTPYQVAFADSAQAAAEDIKDIMQQEHEDSWFESQILDRQTAEAELLQENIQAFLTADEEDEHHYTIHYLSASNDSTALANMVMDAMELYLEKLQIIEVEKNGLDREEILHPISFDREDLSTAEETLGSVMGGIIPVLMIISIVMGAVYPAIDVTAGEKERGTLETLITLPVTNFEMILSKFLTVALAACVSALINILSMGAALGFMGSVMLEEMGVSELHLVTFLPAVLISIVVMLFFSLFVASICLFVCLFAKSFKEANNYVTPVLIVFMLTAYAGMLPDFKLTAVTAGIPVVNITLMIKQLFSMEYNYTLFGIVLISNAAYSLLMIGLLAKVYNSEAVLFGEGFTGVRLFEKRSAMKKGQMPGYGDILLLICGSLLFQFYVGTIAQMKWGFTGVAVTQASFLLFPILYAWYLKNDWKRLFSIKKPKVRHAAGAVFLWVGTYCIANVAVFLLAPLMSESLKTVETTFDPMIRQPVFLLWVVIACMPAIGEELMFRGFIFGTLKEKGKTMAAMLVSAAIFGLFHMSLIKFFSTFILGFFIALAVQKSGTIFTGMLIHLINNTFSVVLMKYPEITEKVPLLSLLETLDPTLGQSIAFTLIGAAGIALGLHIIGGKNGTVHRLNDN